MALSDWACLFVDEEGKSCEAWSTDEKLLLKVRKAGLTVENLNEHDIDLNTGSGSIYINSGSIVYKGWNIEARCDGPQRGIYVLAYSPSTYDLTTGKAWGAKEDDPKVEPKLLFGCSVYAWEDHYEKAAPAIAQIMDDVGLDKDSWESSILGSTDGEGNFQHWVSFLRQKEDGEYEWHHPNHVAQDEWFDGYQLPPETEPQVIGVTKESVEFLKKWCQDMIKDSILGGWPANILDAIDFDNLLQYNAGDAFFAHHIGFEVPATAINEQQSPILTEMLKEMKIGE